ncbi:hypothetical protein FRX31_030499 [Thalictrum thalictroides]|uniref:Uncharacterized protein n=1 Tax=Thalictrum thalictroides TaxID=46969 RepID=A0A7J6V4M1_THATH|nr:hypothetical protein FRX31_030499 [Thalictrum thalictroides]
MSATTASTLVGFSTYKLLEHLALSELILEGLKTNLLVTSFCMELSLGGIKDGMFDLGGNNDVKSNLGLRISLLPLAREAQLLRNKLKDEASAALCDMHTPSATPPLSKMLN